MTERRGVKKDVASRPAFSFRGGLSGELQKKMRLLAEALSKGELKREDAMSLAGLYGGNFDEFIKRMTYVYPIYEYGGRKRTVYGLLKSGGGEDGFVQPAGGTRQDRQKD